MFELLTHAEMSARKALGSSMYRHRGKQFVQRHGWPLSLNADGHEVDAYDTEGTTYCVVSSADVHLASARLRPASRSSMLEDHFPNLWRDNATRVFDMLEVTRLCSSPSLGFIERQIATHELLSGICNYLIRVKRRSIFGIVYPSVASRIAKNGWNYSLLDTAHIEEREVYLCQWLADSDTSWEIQERLSDVESRLLTRCGSKLAAA